MENMPIRIDNILQAQAQAVIRNMGIDISSAVRMFLAQVLIEKGILFRPVPLLFIAPEIRPPCSFRNPNKGRHIFSGRQSARLARAYCPSRPTKQPADDGHLCVSGSSPAENHPP